MIFPPKEQARVVRLAIDDLDSSKHKGRRESASLALERLNTPKLKSLPELERAKALIRYAIDHISIDDNSLYDQSVYDAKRCLNVALITLKREQIRWQEARENIGRFMRLTQASKKDSCAG